jgi:ABC-type multidrug transport system ATPase subunit
MPRPVPDPVRPEDPHLDEGGSLRIRNLTFSYSGATVFREFSFATASRVILFRGPSGCGKTTLLKLLSRNLAAVSCAEFSAPKHSLMIVQEDALAPWLTGIQNITQFTGISRSTIGRHPAYAHVERFIEKPAFQMSYGQRRLVELVRATLLSPALLCLDEPFNFLDPVSRKLFTEILLDASVLPSATRIAITSHYYEDFFGSGVAQYVFDGQLPVYSLRCSP